MLTSFCRIYKFSGISNFKLAIKYTKNHEWVQYVAADKKAKVGITNYAQEQLG
jgi:glycine cleavage system H lipoate-binding protein